MTFSLQSFPEVGLILYLYSLVPLEVRTDLAWPKAPIMDHIVRDCLAAKALRQTKILPSGRTFQRPGDHLPIAKGKGQTSLWVS